MNKVAAYNKAKSCKYCGGMISIADWTDGYGIAQYYLECQTLNCSREHGTAIRGTNLAEMVAEWNRNSGKKPC